MEWFNPFGGEGGGGSGPSDAYTKAETNELLNQKVDKVSGKGLSTEDYTTEDKTKVGNLGTAAEHDVPVNGNAGNTEVVMGNDTRLSDARPASDVSDWAKALTKPSYGYDEITGKPTINGVTLIGDLTLSELGIIVDDQLNAQSTNPVQNAVLTALLNAFPYSNVTGKPQINGVTLTGNITLAQLGLNAIWVGTQAEYALVESTLEVGTLVVITDDNDMDSAPTQNSTNVVSSGGVYAFVVQGLDGKVDKVQGKGLSTEDYTTAEKTKLGGIEAEANKTVVDSALDGTSTNPVQNKIVTAAINDISNSVVTIDNNGDLWVGDTQIWHIIDSASYAALQTKENILYLVYPTSS